MKLLLLWTILMNHHDEHFMLSRMIMLCFVSWSIASHWLSAWYGITYRSWPAAVQGGWCTWPRFVHWTNLKNSRFPFLCAVLKLLSKCLSNPSSHWYIWNVCTGVNMLGSGNGAQFYQDPHGFWNIVTTQNAHMYLVLVNDVFWNPKLLTFKWTNSWNPKVVWLLLS